ncbi:MAG TPA: hypothetical protein VE173_06340 [Longimicrobiales bacterium]|jgi:hypothetical protein|nr:hypothetical protein [Longimicrobiales bacterium]
MKTLASLPTIGVALALSAASLLAQQTSTTDRDTTPDSTTVASRLVPATVEVKNHNWLDMHLYVDRDGLLLPVGVVGSGQTAQLRLPLLATAAAGDVRLVAVPIGGNDYYVSPILFLEPGDVVNLDLEDALNFSWATVLPRSEPPSTPGKGS